MYYPFLVYYLLFLNLKSNSLQVAPRAGRAAGARFCRAQRDITKMASDRYGRAGPCWAAALAALFLIECGMPVVRGDGSRDGGSAQGGSQGFVGRVRRQGGGGQGQGNSGGGGNPSPSPPSGGGGGGQGQQGSHGGGNNGGTGLPPPPPHDGPQNIYIRESCTLASLLPLTRGVCVMEP